MISLLLNSSLNNSGILKDFWQIVTKKLAFELMVKQMICIKMKVS